MNFIILIYDISTIHKKHDKLRKLIRQYLHNVQESCFQGYLSDKHLNHLKMKLKPYKLYKSSIIIYKIRAPKYLEIDQLGDVTLEQNNIIDMVI